MQEVCQAVVLTAHQDDHPLPDIGIAQVPVQLELIGHLGESLAKLFGGKGKGVGQHLDPLEELTGGQVAVLGRLHHPSPVGGDEPGDCSHDSGAIGAGDGEDQPAHPTIMASADATDRRTPSDPVARAGTRPPGDAW